MFEYTIEGFKKAKEFLKTKDKHVYLGETGYEVVARANRELEKYIESLNDCDRIKEHMKHHLGKYYDVHKKLADS